MIPSSTPDKVHQPHWRWPGHFCVSKATQICIRKRALLKINKECKRREFNSWVGKICWRRDRQPTPVFLRFPCGSADKESACNVEDLGSIPGLERSPEIRERLQTLVFWPRKFHGLYRPWGHNESDTTECDFHFTC